MKQFVKPIIFQSWLSQVFNSSIYQTWSKNNTSISTNQVDLVNIFSLSVICINFLLTILNIWGTYNLYGIVTLFALIVLLLNKWQYYIASRWLSISGTGIILGCLSTIYSMTWLIDMVFILGLFLIIILFPKDKKWNILGNFSLLTILFILLKISDFSFFAFSQQTNSLFNMVFLLNTSCILLSVTLATYYLFSIYEKSEHNLKIYVQELQAKEIEIKLQNEELLRLNKSLQTSKEDLVKSHIFLNTIIDNLPVTLFVKEVKEMRFIRLNKTGEALMNYTEKEIVNKTNSDLFLKAQAENFTQSDRKVLAEKKIVETEEYLTNRNNQTHIIRTKKVPIFNNFGDPLYILGLSEDITPQKQAEEILRRTVVELEVRNHELDNYVYRVSHDLRSPLCSMLGLINLAKAESDICIIKDYIRLIESSVGKSDRFIQSILNHSKILNTDPQTELIDFKKMIHHCLEELNFESEKIHIQTNIHIEATNEFYNDEFRVNLILKNILSNALKYFNPDVAERVIACNINIDDKLAEIVIEDNGVGIEAQYLPKIFDMFFRGTEKSTGSGLGLYIAKQATQTLGGNIVVTSDAGKGTKFTVTLSNKCAPNIKIS